MTKPTYRLTEEDLRNIAVRIAESDFPPYEVLDWTDPNKKCKVPCPMSANSIYDMLSGTIEEYVEAQEKANGPYEAADAAYQAQVEGK